MILHSSNDAFVYPVTSYGTNYEQHNMGLEIPGLGYNLIPLVPVGYNLVPVGIKNIFLCIFAANRFPFPNFF